MPFQPVPNTAQVEIRCVKAGIPVEHVFNCLSAVPIIQEDLDALTAVVDEYVDESLLAVYPTDLVYVETYARALDAAIDVESTNSTGAGVGTNTGEPEPNNVSFPIKLTTGLTGRSARGRMYWLGMTADQTASGVAILTATANGFVALIEGLQTAIATTGFQLAIVQRWEDGSLLPAGIPRVVTDVGYSSLRLASMRGRLK